MRSASSPWPARGDAIGAFTLRLPDDSCERLKALSERRRTRVNRLLDEIATLLPTEFDAEARVALRAERGQDKAQRGVELLRRARAT